MFSPAFSTFSRLLLLAALVAVPACNGSHDDATDVQWSSNNPSEPGAANWSTILVAGPDAIRVAAPPLDNSATTAEDMQEVRASLAALTPAQTSAVHKWDTNNPSEYWRDALDDVILTSGWGPPNASRAYALLGIAIHDATITAWNNQYFYKRRRPEQMDPAVHALVATPQHPAYPSDQAAVASAASRVMISLFPDKAAIFEALANEETESQVWGGLNQRADLAAGTDLGNRVADAILAVAASDRHVAEVYKDQDLDFLHPTPMTPARFTPFTPSATPYSDAITWDSLVARRGSTYDDATPWVEAKPLEPTAGSWKPLVLADADHFAIPPPPANSSPETTTCMQEIADYLNSRGDKGNFAGDYIIMKWANDQPGHWFLEALDLQIRSHDLSAPAAARATALMNDAIYEALLVSWNLKWDYLKPRPYHLDPAMKTVIPTPAHPSYPSGHATVGGAGIAVLRALFPENQSQYMGLLDEVNNARVWGGVHYRFDMTAGNQLGEDVTAEILARVHPDGTAGS
ncbi:MAG: vanadium-dependent haloperoxidase [bacterium]